MKHLVKSLIAAGLVSAMSACDASSIDTDDSYGQEPDLVGLPGVHIEVKRREVVDLAAALKQAAEDAERFGDGIPAVFARGNRQKWRVTMLLDDWLNLYQRYLRK